MNRTITAMFDTRADAEAGKQRLIAANIDTDNVRIHDQSSEGYNQDSSSTTASTGQNGMWGSVKNAMLPDEDRHTYEEGIRRGGVVLSADVDDDEVDAAVRALEETSCVDMEDRSKSWRNEGWTGPQAAIAGAARKTDGLTSGDEQKLKVVEEQLVVGKRETERGGVRVRSYVTEKPVHEQVRLREEHVNVERRPVDQRLEGGAGDAFQERTIELTERNEEAVVGKEARVVEEVVLSKTAGERVEEINETVRKTDVEVEQLGGTDRSRGVADTDYAASRSKADSSRTGESIRDKARGAVETVKDDLGLGDKNKR